MTNKEQTYDMADENFPEMIDALGEKPNGERVLIGKVPMPPEMKMKDIIRNYIGMDFADEDSAESYALYAMQDFYDWHQKQTAALAELKDADILREPAQTCTHDFHYFGDQVSERRCNNCNKRKSQTKTQESEKTIAGPVADDVINRVAVELRGISEDPMWADHVEISKSKMFEWANALEGVYAAVQLTPQVLTDEQISAIWNASIIEAKDVGDEVNIFARAILAASQNTREPELCEDEGCPHHGTPHVCIDSSRLEELDIVLNVEPRNRTLTELITQVKALMQAIANAAYKAGIYNGEVLVDGPQLLILLDDMTTMQIAVAPQEPAQADAQAVYQQRSFSRRDFWFDVDKVEYDRTPVDQRRTLYTRPADSTAIRNAALEEAAIVGARAAERSRYSDGQNVADPIRALKAEVRK
jgi:hypothetical protein